MKYNNLSLNEIINYCLSRGKEGDFWDFKQEWHEKIEDLVKDIICFANTIHDENCFLVFGIADDLTITGMKARRRKQADIIDALSKLSFAGDVSPQITLETVVYMGEELDVLIVHNTNKTPIFLMKPYGKMKQGCIYSREGDRNTPDNGNAKIAIIESLWKKRFGLTKTPLEFIFESLINKDNWCENKNGYYHIFKSEYTMERVIDNEKYDDEYYSFAQTNETTSYHMLDLKCKGTILDSYQIVDLDSGRLSVPVPEWGYICLDDYHQNIVAYKCYIEGSHREKLLRFMYDPHDGDQRWAYRNLDAVTLLFKNDDEQRLFERYVACNRYSLKSRVDSSEEFDYIDTGNEVKTNGYKQSLRTALILKQMLKEYRDEEPA